MRLPVLLTMLALPVPLAAQFEQNPEERIREIADEIADELQEIDKLLLQTGSAKQAGHAAESIASVSKRMNDLLEQTTKSQTNAVKRMDELISEIEKISGC